LLRFATISLPIKFEVSIFTRYEDTKGDSLQNVENWEVSGDYGSFKVTENSAIQ